VSAPPPAKKTAGQIEKETDVSYKVSARPLHAEAIAEISNHKSQTAQNKKYETRNSKQIPNHNFPMLQETLYSNNE
jgi:hypothetical protein